MKPSEYYDNLLNELEIPAEEKERTEEENQWESQRSNPANNPSDKTNENTGGFFEQMTDRIANNPLRTIGGILVVITTLSVVWLFFR